jgi:hypothetical protein
VPTVTVYRFRQYDINGDLSPLSRCWATREAIARIDHAWAIEDTALEVDEAVLRTDEPGRTDTDFDPSAVPEGQSRG